MLKKQPNQENKARRTINVLFVEDNLFDYQIFKRALESNSPFILCQSDLAQDYDDAIKVIRENRHDIYFIDYSLDKENGLELIKVMNDEGHKGPFVMLTSFEDSDFIGQSLELGIYDYLLKGEITPSLLQRTMLYTIERKKIEDRLAEDKHRQKLEALGQMAGGIAHELNNLLQPIMFKADNILEETSDDLIKRDATKILDCTKKASDIVADILSYAHAAKSEKGYVDLLHVLLKNIEFAKEITPSSIDIVVSDTSAMNTNYKAYIDETDLFRVLTNLFSNAVSAMEYCGKISLSYNIVELSETEISEHNLRSRGSEGLFAQIIVQDSGPGIAPDKIDKIFVPFFTTKNIGEGTGLGLSMVYGILQSWGGAIYLDEKNNDNEYIGAKFVILIPIQPTKNLGVHT